MVLPLGGTEDQWATANPGRRGSHQTVTLQSVHHLGRMPCPELVRVNMSQLFVRATVRSASG